MKKAMMAVLLAGTFSLGACASDRYAYDDDPTLERAATGAAVGAVGGAALGAVVPGVSPVEGAVAGAVVGGVAGAVTAPRRDADGDGYYEEDRDGDGYYEYEDAPPPPPPPAYRSGERG